MEATIQAEKTQPEDTRLQDWRVTYGENGLLFECKAENIEHAIEQCRNAYPDEPILGAQLGLTDIVRVFNWDAAEYGNDGENCDPFLMEISDHRHTSGQVHLCLAPEDGDYDDNMYLALEVNRLHGSKDNVQCAHLHFDNDNLALSIFKNGAGRYILRPEVNVTIRQTKLPDGDVGYIVE